LLYFPDNGKNTGDWDNEDRKINRIGYISYTLIGFEAKYIGRPTVHRIKPPFKRSPSNYKKLKTPIY
jgi:hypothetical protein